MSAKGYLSPEGVARFMRKGYYSPVGVARKLVKAYCSPDGVARLAWEAGGESGPVRAYLYNGVKLPELPEWDRGKYPSVCITQNGSGVIACHIHQAVVYALSDRVVLTAPYKNYLLSSDGTTWEYQSGSTGTHKATFSPLIWTDTDAYNKDGTELILEASDPVPLCSYNGTELPALPDYDETVYPYAYIKVNYKNDDTVWYYALYLYSNEVYVTEKGVVCHRFDSVTKTFTTYNPDDETSWGELQEPAVNTNGILWSGHKNIIWANFDLLYEDGTKRLPENEPQPQPVYL